ncbi:MAG: GntP family permease [Acidobacteriota bacterium]|nr:GntP family permease [Acidobacteriota bacterium]
MTLLFLTLGAIILLLILILVVRMHAFLAMLLTSMALGLAAGMPPTAALKSIQNGFGEALGFIFVVLGLGAMIGAYLEHSGGGRVLADWLLERFGRERAAWAILSAAYLVGLPIFFEVGFIILVPLVWNLARESKRSLLLYGLPMAAALTVTHALVPPHPAPAAAAQLLGADLGRAILYGIAISFPMAVVGGILYGGWVSKRVHVPVPEMATSLDAPLSNQRPPHVALIILLLLLPVLLILAATLAGPSHSAMVFLGHPFTALAVTALCAMVFLGAQRGLSRTQIADLATASLGPIGSLALIMGAGGALKQVIVDTGAGAYAGRLLASSDISLLLVAYIITACMRIAQGSATVSIITAAGLVAPMLKAVSGYRPELVYLAVCCGGTSISHVNDAGFWLVKVYFGMSVPQTLKTWSVMKAIVSLFGLGLVLIAHRLWG